MRSVWVFGGSFAAALLLAAATVRAEGTVLDRFEPSERGSRFFTADSLPLSTHLLWAAGAVVDVAHEPLVVLDENGRHVATPVKDQFFTHLGASVTLAGRVRVALNLPILLTARTAAFEADDFSLSPGDGPALGDVRLSGDVRLLGGHEDPLTLAAGLSIYAPTGSQDALTSDGSLRLRPRLQAAGRIGDLVYAAHVSTHVRTGDGRFAGEPDGTSLTLGAAVGLTALGGRFTFGPELVASSDLSRGAFLSRKATPFEAILGAHWEIARALRVGGGLGPGLSQGVGAPAVRYLWSLEFSPREAPLPRPPDGDRDGIFDRDDACPMLFGPPSREPRAHGCPQRLPDADADADGITNERDACPESAGPKTPGRPETFGCPLPPDADKDGFVDAADACPNEPGGQASDPKKNGCPPPGDTDDDGILDDRDACVDRRGMTNADPAWNGCPSAVIVGSEIRLLGHVRFERNRAKLVREGEEMLLAVARLMIDEPGIRLLSVEVHTASSGAPRRELELSKKRAETVIQWLTETGVEPKRLAPSALGSERPVFADTTREGKAKNDRVEFRILERSDAPRYPERKDGRP
jgi:outer membrane protein OmpA-like peptidoglycan-associated protein